MSPNFITSCCLWIGASAILSMPLAAAKTISELAQERVGMAVEVRKAEGIEAGVARLEAEATRWINNSEEPFAASFHPFFFAAWKEGQVRSGRDDPLWGAAMYEWMFGFYGRNEALKVYHQQVFPNLILTSSAAGKMGRVKVLLDAEKARMEADQILVPPSGYEDLGPLFEELPEIRRRGIAPIANAAGAPVRRAPYNQDDIRSVGLLASQDFREGRWRTGLERATVKIAWGYSRMELTGKQPRDNDPAFGEYSNEAASASHTLGMHLKQLGFLELSNQWLTELKDAPWSGYYRDRFRQLSKLAIERSAIRLGIVDRSSLKRLDTMHKWTGRNIYLTSNVPDHVLVAKAELLIALGELEEGWALFEDVKARQAEDPFVLRAWSNARIAAGRLEGVESALISMLEKARAAGVKSDEVACYRLYARLLARSGRVTQAIAAQRELLRLVRAFDYYAWEPNDLAVLAHLLARGGDRAGAEGLLTEVRTLLARDRYLPPWLRKETEALLDEPLPETDDRESEKASVVFRPQQASAMAIEGFAARSVISLFNPTAHPVKGTVTFEGDATEVLWDEARAYGAVRVAPKRPREIPYVLLQLAGGATALFDLSTDVAGATQQGSVTLRWKGAGDSRDEASWTFEPSEAGVAAAIIDAGAYEDTPFVLIPIYHFYQFRDGTQSSANLRIVTSQPSRVEIYDSTPTLLAVDAQGDGLLDGPGDSLSQDADRDGFADLALPDGSGEVPFLLMVRPLEALPEKGVEVVIETIRAGEWRRMAIDTILPSSRASPAP